MYALHIQIQLYIHKIQMLSNLPSHPQINHHYFQGDYRHHCQPSNCFDVIIIK